MHCNVDDSMVLCQQNFIQISDELYVNVLTEFYLHGQFFLSIAIIVFSDKSRYVRICNAIMVKKKYC